MTKIILVANTDWYLYNFRRSLASAILREDMDLVLASPAGAYTDRLQRSGFAWQELPMSRRGINPLEETSTFLSFRRLYRRERPDLVHQFTSKVVLYGSFAARASKVPAVVNSVTGLGYVFVNQSLSAKLMRPALRAMYTLALRTPRSRAIFQNSVDRQRFIEMGIVDPEQTTIVRGSGVDPERFTPSPEPPGPPVILMVSRMLLDKGVGEYVQAARILQRRGFQGKAVLVGNTDPGNPASVSEEQLRAWVVEGAVEWWGSQDDMPAVYRRAHIVTLPSYGEGLPKALIEAAAMGKPIVASDVTGCREVVQHGVNGYLVAPRDAEALASALEELTKDASKRAAMGQAGRRLVLEHFTDEQVNRETLAVYRGLLGRGKADKSQGLPLHGPMPRC